MRFSRCWSAAEVSLVKEQHLGNCGIFQNVIALCQYQGMHYIIFQAVDECVECDILFIGPVHFEDTSLSGNETGKMT